MALCGPCRVLPERGEGRMTQHRRRTGGQVLVDQLLAQGVERLTCVPGESYLAVLDALLRGGNRRHDLPQRGRGGDMAEAYGKLTGRPGICFVTRGPGATNATTACISRPRTRRR